MNKIVAQLMRAERPLDLFLIAQAIVDREAGLPTMTHEKLCELMDELHQNIMDGRIK